MGSFEQVFLFFSMHESPKRYEMQGIGLFPITTVTASVLMTVVKLMMYIPRARTHVCNFEILNARQGYAGV